MLESSFVLAWNSSHPSFKNLSLLHPDGAVSFSSDLHRFRAGVGEPIQRPGDLHQEPHGAIPRRQLLRGLPPHVSAQICQRGVKRRRV